MRNMRAASIIVIPDDNHVGATEAFTIFGAPLVSATRVARRREPKFAQIVRVLLALYNKHHAAAGHGVPHLGQPIKHAARITKRPDPATFPVGTSLPEVFWRASHDLEQQHGRLVIVIICRDDGGWRGFAIFSFLRSTRRVADDSSVSQPLQAVILGRAKSQIERATANTVLVVEPDTLRAVDYPRAVHTPTKLSCFLDDRLAPHNAGHRLAVESEVAVISHGLFALGI